MKRLLLLGTVLAVAAGLAATTADARTLEQIIADGTVRIGVTANFPPMSSYDSNQQLEGVDIDVGNAFAKAIGVKAEFVPTEVDQRVPFLVSDRIDICLGGLTRTPERAKLIDYTLPLSTESLQVLTTDKVEGKTWEDLNKAGIRYTAVHGTWTLDWAKEHLPNATAVVVDGPSDMVRSIAQGRADALIDNLDYFLGLTKQYPNVNWVVYPDPVKGSVGYVGAGVHKGNDGLRLFLNVVIYGLESSGFVDDAWQKWYGHAMAVPVVPNPYF